MDPIFEVQTTEIYTAIECVAQSAVSNWGWIYLCWAMSSKEGIYQPFYQTSSRLLMQSMPDGILLCISSAWSSNCLYCEFPHLSVWINVPTCLRGGEVIYLCLSLYIDWDLDGMEQSWVSLLLPLSIISQAPTHPIEKEEAAKTYANTILHFILLSK